MMIIGFGKKKGAEDEDEEKSYGKSDEDEGPSLSGMASKRAAKSIIEAIESGDAGALDQALKDHYSACEE